MKKAIAWFLSVHLVLFASLYYVQTYTVCTAPAKEVQCVPDAAKVLSARFENMLNFFDGERTHTVENYTLNADGTYTVVTKVNTDSSAKPQQGISLFAPAEESSFGYDLLSCNIIDMSSLANI